MFQVLKSVCATVKARFYVLWPTDMRVLAVLAMGCFTTALSEKWFSLSGQGHEAFDELNDFSWQPPGGGNLR